MNLQKSHKDNNTPQPASNRLTAVLLVIYLLVLVWVLLLKSGVHFSYMQARTINLVPFNQPLILNGHVNITEMVLNAVIFIPLGVYTAVLFMRWRFAKKLFFFFAVSLIIETLQFIFSIGAFDITDIITNTTGGITGVLLFAFIEQLFKTKHRAIRFINIIAAAGTALLIVLLVLLKLNLLPVRYQ
jgi:glycopeptide antibiotics resistance protein